MTSIFGPLEQFVAAVVIIGLALQAPPAFWTSGPTFVPASSNATLPASSRGALTEAVPRGTTQHSMLAFLNELLPGTDGWHVNPITLALIGMGINIAYSLIPVDLICRLKESWHVFWPPWQNRSQPSTNTHASPRESPENDRPRKSKTSTEDKPGKSESGEVAERPRKKEAPKENDPSAEKEAMARGKAKQRKDQKLQQKPGEQEGDQEKSEAKKEKKREKEEVEGSEKPKAKDRDKERARREAAKAASAERSREAEADDGNGTTEDKVAEEPLISSRENLTHSERAPRVKTSESKSFSTSEKLKSDSKAKTSSEG